MKRKIISAISLTLLASCSTARIQQGKYYIKPTEVWEVRNQEDYTTIDITPNYSSQNLLPQIKEDTSRRIRYLCDPDLENVFQREYTEHGKTTYTTNPVKLKKAEANLREFKKRF